MAIRSTAPLLSTQADRPADASTRLQGRRLLVARVAWITLAGLAMVVLVVAVPVFYQSSRTILETETRVPGQLTLEDVRLLEQWGLSLDFYAAYQTATIVGLSLVFMAAGAMLFLRRSDDRIVLFVSLWFVLVAMTGSPLLDPLVRLYPAWLLPVRFLQGASIGCFPIFTYVFPDGRFVPRWTRMLTIAWVAWIVIAPFTPLVVADFNGISALWFGVLVPAGILAGIVAQVYRYRRVSGRVERQQTKWMLFAVAVVAVSLVVYALLPRIIPSVAEPGLTRVLYLNVTETFLLVLPCSLLPLCIGIAILRHRLYDIDLLINRTLVYGALSAGVVGLYVLLVGALGALFQSSGNLADRAAGDRPGRRSLVQPLRARLQRGVNRLMYGERDDPYAVLSRLSQQLKTTLAPTAVLPSIAETVAADAQAALRGLALTQRQRAARSPAASRTGRRRSPAAAAGLSGRDGRPAAASRRARRAKRSRPPSGGCSKISPCKPASPRTPCASPPTCSARASDW